MVNDSAEALLRATDSELKCLLAGYILDDEPRTVKDIHTDTEQLVGIGRVPGTPNALRYHLCTCMNPNASLAPFVDAQYSPRSARFKLNATGKTLAPLARFRLTQSLRQGIPIDRLFALRGDLEGHVRCLLASHDGATVQELSTAADLSVKQVSDFLDALVDTGLAERTLVPNGKGRRLAMRANGKLSAYMAEVIQPMRAYLAAPEDPSCRAAMRGVAHPDLAESIAQYERATATVWRA